MLRRILIVVTLIALVAVSTGIGVLVARWPEVRSATAEP
jgi:hypothetical protein